jgi:hypothetical protein
MSYTIVHPSLEQETERLNRALVAAAAALAALKLGVFANVPLEVGNPPGGRCLGFGKFDGAWRLLICNADGSDAFPLANASREFRTRAPLCLERLLDALKKEAAEQALTVSGAADRAQAFAAQVMLQAAPQRGSACAAKHCLGFGTFHGGDCVFLPPLPGEQCTTCCLPDGVTSGPCLRCGRPVTR